MKKIVSLILSLLLVFSFSACSPLKDATYKVGICRYSDHPAQANAIDGFKAALTEKLSDKVSFDDQHASGDSATCSLIVNNFVSTGADLILADTTQSLQIAAAATNITPILGAAITDYATALDVPLISSLTGINVTGTSDLAPLESQADMITELFPDAKNIGLIYCSSEVNSIYQVNVIQQLLSSKGVNCREYSFSDSNDLAQVATAASLESDVIYLPTDNTIAECTGIIDDIFRPAGIPVVAGEKGICAGCGVATLSIDYYELGKKTGEMAYKILVEGALPSEMPIEYDEVCTKMYNKEICDELGISIPEDYIVIE